MSPAIRRRMRNRIGRGLTFEKVWATIERNAEEAEKRAAEWEAKWQKEAEQRKKEAAEWEAKQQKEAEQRKKEAAEWEAKQQKEAEQRKKEAAEWEAKQQKEAEQRKKEDEQRKKEADRQMQEVRDAHKETERTVNRVSEQMGGLHNSFGQMAEHLVAPGIVEKFNDLGFHITQAAIHGMRILDEKKEVRAEIDLFMGNGEYIIAIEVKAKLGKDDIEKHRKRMKILREDTNKTGDRRKIMGGIAVAILGENDKKAILDAGFYLLVQSGDTMKIEVPESFIPQKW